MNTPLWSEFQEALRLKGKPYDLTRWLERAALRSADRVVALTDGYGRNADTEMGLDRGRVTVIANAVGARSGLARTWRLASRNGTVAIVFGLIDGARFCYILLACDYVAYARFSPGRVALDRVMAAWAAEGGTMFDFTIGDEAFKAGFGCTRTSMYEFAL